jgi:hypothetical protein
MKVVFTDEELMLLAELVEAAIRQDPSRDDLRQLFSRLAYLTKTTWEEF